MMQSRTSFAIILPEIRCFLPLGLRFERITASVGAKLATVEMMGTSWNEVGEESTSPV